MRFTRIGAISSARLATNAGSAAVPAAAILKTDGWAAGSGAAHKQQRPSRSHLADSLPSDLEQQQEVRTDFFACLRKIHIHEPRTVRPARSDHYRVDRPRQVTEELLEGSGVGSTEGYVTQRAKLCRGALETLPIPTSENYLGSLGACNAGRFETDAGAAADHSRLFARELRFAYTVVVHCGSSPPDCSASMYAAYQSGQFSSRLPVRFSCSPCAASTRRSASARSFTDA